MTVLNPRYHDLHYSPINISQNDIKEKWMCRDIYHARETWETVVRTQSSPEPEMKAQPFSPQVVTTVFEIYRHTLNVVVKRRIRTLQRQMVTSQACVLHTMQEEIQLSLCLTK
jgi:hypothetical protein